MWVSFYPLCSPCPDENPDAALAAAAAVVVVVVVVDLSCDFLLCCCCSSAVRAAWRASAAPHGVDDDVDPVLLGAAECWGRGDHSPRRNRITSPFDRIR